MRGWGLRGDGDVVVCFVVIYKCSHNGSLTMISLDCFLQKMQNLAKDAKDAKVCEKCKTMMRSSPPTAGLTRQVSSTGSNGANIKNGRRLS